MESLTGGANPVGALIGGGLGGVIGVPLTLVVACGGMLLSFLWLLLSPVRSLVKVVTSFTSDYKELVNERGTSAGWVAETGTRSGTTTSTFRERVMTHGELYATKEVLVEHIGVISCFHESKDPIP